MLESGYMASTREHIIPLREEYREFFKPQIIKLRDLLEARLHLLTQSDIETELDMPEEGGRYADWVASIGVTSQPVYLSGNLEDETAITLSETDKPNVYLRTRRGKDDEWARKSLLILKEKPMAIE